MARPENWLGAFIEDEIHHVLSWSQKQQSTPQVKPDPECRFEDDHSNFRSFADSSILPSNPHVQISSILSLEGQVRAFVTDGFTRVKARLSRHVVATLEGEFDDTITLDTKNDIIAIRDVTVESTPYGPSDGFVQFYITDIDYLHHLRKPLGTPRPVEERANVVRFIEEITALRQKQQAVLNEPGDPSPPSSPPIAARRSDTPNVLIRNEIPQSPHSIRTSQHSLPIVSQLPTTQLALATQVPDRRKAKGPTLVKDGFEIKDGVNLARPVQPTQANLHTAGKKFSSEQVAVASGTIGLFNLFGKRKAADSPEKPRASKLRSLSPVMSQREAPSVIPESAAEPVSAPKRHLVPAETMHEAQHERVPEPETDPAPEREIQHDTFTSIPSAQRPRETTPSATIPAKVLRRDYSRRKVPRDQQKLLDKPSSWLPSLPGQQFPRPNVPIELLKQWNARAAEARNRSIAKNGGTQMSHATDARGGAEQQPEVDMDGDESESSLSTDSSEDENLGEEELGENEWPPSSPVQRDDRLPPDSTNASATHSSVINNTTERAKHSSENANGRLSTTSSAASVSARRSTETAPPVQRSSGLPPDSNHASPIQRQSFAPPASTYTSPMQQQQSYSRPPSSSLPSPRVPHPLPPRPDWAPRSSWKPFHPAPACVRASQDVQRSVSRPSTADGPPQFVAPPPTTRVERRPTSDEQRRDSRPTTTNNQSHATVPPLTATSVGRSPPNRRTNDSRSYIPSSRMHTTATPPAQIARTSHQDAQRGDSRPSTAGSQRNIGGFPSTAPTANFMKPSPRPSIRPNATPNRPDTVVVRGTQFSPISAGEDMEMSVPRSLGQEDPHPAHRQRRSKFLRPAQRRKWIEDHYDRSRTRASQFTPMYRAYKNAYAKDPLTPAQFAEALDVVCPSTATDDSVTRDGPRPPQSTAARPAADNVASTFSSSKLQMMSADLDGADDASSPTVRRLVSAGQMTNPIDISSDGGEEASGSVGAVGKVRRGDEAPTHEVVEREKRDEAISVFAEFARVWKNLKPGGAFAAVDSGEATGRKAQNRLNVLEWGW